MSNIAKTLLKELEEIKEKQKDKDMDAEWSKQIKDTAEKVMKAVIKK